jgi:hypothetical protein
MPGFEPTADARTFGSGEGEIVLWHPADGVAAARVTGYIVGRLASATFAEIDRVAEVRGHPARGFCDFSEMTGFDWDARGVFVRWNIVHRNQASRFDVLSGSWITHAVLTALGKVMGERLVSHAERATFEAAYGALLRKSSERMRRSRLSSPP